MAREYSVSANEAYTESEKQEIALALSNALKVKFETHFYIEASAQPLDPIILIVLGYLGGRILEGFLSGIGSDAWNVVKEKFRTAVLNKKRSRIWITGKLNGTEISLSTDTTETTDPKSLDALLDDLGRVLRETSRFALKRELPGNKQEIFYRFSGELKWEIEGLIVKEPGFEKFRYDKETQKWIRE